MFQATNDLDFGCCFLLFAVFIALCTLLGTFLGSLMQGNIICGMDFNLNST